MPDFRSKAGYTLVEMIMVVIILGIIAAVAATTLRNSNDVARTERTRVEMDRLAEAIAGDPEMLSAGNRTDFGYVGDVGALPPNLDALAHNPGLTTWQGPYAYDDISPDGSSSAFKTDAWGKAFSYSGGVTITSTGSGTAITRSIANSTDELLYNRLSAVVTDLDNTPPGLTFQDSVLLALTFPDGAGSYRSVVASPGPDGAVNFDSIPIGLHYLEIVYIPDSDSTHRKVVVNTGEDSYIQIQLPQKLW